MNTRFNLSAGPHVRDRWTTAHIMRLVLLAMLPATVVGCVVFGVHALLIVLSSVTSAVLTELLFDKLTGRPDTWKDGSAAVTGLMLALTLSGTVPLYIPILGSIFAILVVKCAFGGLGKNFINPALAARCFLLISFGNAMTEYGIDGVSSATPVAELAAGKVVNITSMFLGTANGVIGGSILALLVGGLFLWCLDVIHGQICFSVLGGFTLFMALFGGKGFDINYLLAHLCGGGVVMGAFFMATDYVTSPVSRLGQFIYGCLIGVLGGVFRLYGNTADSFSYAIIIGNVCTPLIDTYIVQKPFAYRKVGRTRPVSREPFRIPKPVIALTLIAAVAGVALSGVYSMTQATIEKQELQKKTAAYKEVCPEASTFETLEAAEKLLAAQDEKAMPRINEFYEGRREDGSVAGYAVSMTSKGFGGDVTMALGLTPEGEIVRIAFTELTETAGLGMRASEDGFRNQFVGKSGQVTLVKGDAGDGEISALSGATVTSNAVVNGVNAALDFFQDAMKGGN